MCSSASEQISVRIMVDLPLRGAPTTAAWPAAPDRSTQSGSRRCSNGRSTIPVTARSLPRQSRFSTPHPYCCVIDSGGSSWSSVGGTSSGGSQT